MDLRSGYPFWLVRNGFFRSYPSVRQPLETDVIVLGAGITGALVAHALCSAGIEAVVVDRRNVGMGSTCASTALLQYEIDTPLHTLIGYVGRDHAERSYQACLEAIDRIRDICRQEHIQADFEEKKSLYYASRKADLDSIEKEFSARRQMGIHLEKLSSEDVKSAYGIRTAGALLSEKAAQVDPYRLAHGLLLACKKRGLPILDNTEISQIRNEGKKVELITADGYQIRGRKMVYATGYEALELLKKPVATLHSTYAVVSEPLEDIVPLWKEACLIWETAVPYLYLRTTPDRRVLVGGKDEPFYSPSKRDRLLSRKSKQLVYSFQKLFPSIPFYPDYAWCGTFAETKDGLPFIGSVKQYPNSYFALGFGGNGITFSALAAQLVRDDILGRPNPQSALFSFDR